MIVDNKALIEKYPFLKIEGYDDGTWLDDLEPGWRIAFGKELCDELLESLLKDNCLDEFKFFQIKEKFGALRLYAFGYGECTKEVLAKYEELSKYYCGHCGNPARYITRGWIYPLCKDCISKVNSSYVPIEEFYGFESYDDVESEMKNIIENFNYGDYYIIMKIN